MDGVHDLGGKAGHGDVMIARNEVAFGLRWEAGVFAMSGAGARAGAWSNSDRFRHAIERIDPEAYLTHGYYGRWLGGIETLLVEAGIVDQAALTRRAKEMGATDADLIAARPKRDPDPKGPVGLDSGAERTSDQAAKFEVGELIVTSSEVKAGHTRLPEYARGREGHIINRHGAWVYPDTNAHGLGEQPQHLYTVRFKSEVLWNKPGFSVCLDLFEPYLSRPDQPALSNLTDQTESDL